MNLKRLSIVFVLFFAGLLVLLSPATIGAQEHNPQLLGAAGSAIGTAFSYQGRLTDGGLPANGSYDFRFYLWAEESKTTLLGTYPATGTIAVDVVDGNFTVTLDFGVGVFDGDERWLEIEVNGSLLAPLQPITPAPYAIYAQNAPWSGLSGVPAGFADNTDDGLTSVTWLDILDRPSGLDDGDQDTTYSPGYGLGLANTTFSVLTDTIQTRITGACGAGYAIRQVNADGSVVCEQDDGLDYYPGYGMSLVETIFSVMTDTIQARVSGTCAVGSTIRVINQDGTVVCEIDDDTTYSKGDGLVLAGTVFSVDFAGSGSASTAARSDHDHNSAYVNEGQENSITTGMVQDGTLQFADLNHNGCSPDQVIKWDGISWVCAGDETGSGSFWSLAGNNGTNPAINYLGTSDNQPLELRVNNQRAFYLEPNELSPNIIGGFGGNYTFEGIYGAVIAGGGTPNEEGQFSPNRVTDHHGAVVGGANNQAGDNEFDLFNAIYAFVGGGYSNKARGGFSTVVGGDANQTAGSHASIGGGMVNIAWGPWSTISGGEWNQAGGINAVVGGGSTNHALGDYSTIAGGVGITVTAYAGTVAGGANNSAEGESSSIGGGLGNLGLGAYSVIGGGYANVAPGYYSNINGGMTNDALGDFSVVGGGYDNTAMNPYSTVGGGSLNVAWADFATVSGGGPLDPGDPSGFNQVTDNYGTIGGGADNNVGSHDGNPTNARFATISGGASNTASNGYAFVGGGQENVASGEWSTVSGGSYNTASGQYAMIGGGWSNVSEAYGAVISGGIANHTIGDKSGIGAGMYNITSQEGSYIGGGYGNFVVGLYGLIGGGYLNEARANYATVGGGAYNTASGLGSTVAGGGGIYETWTYTNTASGDWSVVSGGITNLAAGNSSAVCGGESNTANSWASTVAGGSNNVASNLDSTIGGGANNIASGPSSTVGGGWTNRALESASTVSGGDNNTASGEYSTVGGGDLNSATDDHATVGGGEDNHATAPRSIVAGGYNNAASNWNATVAGGNSNAASGGGTFVGGGDNNTASGADATVPGGADNLAQGYYSFAAGRRAHAYNDGCFVWGDSTDADVACNNNNRWVVRSSGGVYFYSNSGLSSGTYLPAGANSWSGISDRRVKENFRVVDSQAILEELAALPIQEYNLKSQDPVIRHIGPVAQDFASFGYGESDLAINLQDADGVALAAIQGLYAISQEQAEQIEDLQVENASLRKQLGGGFPEGGSNSLSILVYILAGVVVLLLGGFIWVLVRIRSLLPSEAPHAS